MAVTLPTYMVQQMDQDAQRWMKETRALLDRADYNGLQQKVQNSICYFGTFEKPVFFYSGVTFSPILTLIRELFSANRYIGANFLMGTFYRVEIFSRTMGFYALAIQAIQNADLTESLMKCLSAVQRLLIEEKAYFYGQRDKNAMRALEPLQEQADLAHGTLELKSILQKWD